MGMNSIKFNNPLALFVLPVLLASICALAEEPPYVTSSKMLVKYQIPETLSEDVKELVFWYRLNEGPWRRGGVFAVGAPIEFTAPEDGTYDFLLDPKSEDSDAPGPQGGAVSTFRCRIDFNRPAVQILDVDFRNDTVILTWRAFDKNFSPRPIEIYLEKGDSDTFLGKFPNRGLAILSVDRKDLPARLKVVAVDRAGNYGMDYSEPLTAPDRSAAKVRPLPVASTQATLPAVRPLPASTSQPSRTGASVPEALREYNLGARYRLRGELDLARVHLTRAVELDSKMIEALVDLGDVFNSLARYNEAVNAYLEALVLDDRDVRARQGLAITRINQGQYREAVVHLEKVCELDPQNLEGWLLLGDGYWMLGNRSEARRSWVQARGLLKVANNARLKPKVDERMKLVE